MLPPEPFPRGKVEPHFIDTLVVLDDSMIKHHGRLLMPYTLTLMNTVSFIGDFCLPDTHECSCISLLAHPHTISDVINMLVDLFWCISDVHKILYGRYHIEPSPLICGANQLTVFYMITASVMKGFKHVKVLNSLLILHPDTVMIQLNFCKEWDKHYSIFNQYSISMSP